VITEEGQEGGHRVSASLTPNSLVARLVMGQVTIKVDRRNKNDF
jgi:hypothetical protein